MILTHLVIWFDSYPSLSRLVSYCLGVGVTIRVKDPRFWCYHSQGHIVEIGYGHIVEIGEGPSVLVLP
jgi:hypothetical protein